MLQYKKQFDSLLGVKSEPNEHEIHLFERGQKYIQKLSKIPGIEMIAIVNSLSMYATHPDSDIDLFIITKPGMIWFVRFFSTLILWRHGVWRKGEDIAGNLCLSFFITTEAMDLSRIAIENDIYLYYWLYSMKPIVIKNNTYEKFLKANTWVEIDKNQRVENQNYIASNGSKVMNSGGLGRGTVGVRGGKEIRGAKLPSFSLPNSFGTFSTKSTENGVGKIYEVSETTSEGQKRIEFYKKINQIIRFFLLPKTIKSKEKLGNPEGILISDTILKFHDRDKRKEIRDTILENNFDK